MSVKKQADIKCGEVFSEDGRYRYRLSREWGTGAGRVSWLMMNPSTADALVDDATIRKCVGFSQRWGFNALDVINLYTLRSRDPKVLISTPHEELDGPDADMHYHSVLQNSSLLVLAWGCEGTLRRLGVTKFTSDVVNDLKRWYPNLTVKCLGQSKTGNPYHPLMLAYDTPLRDVEI